MKSTIIKSCVLIITGLLLGCAAKQAVTPSAAPVAEPAAAVAPIDVWLGKLIAINHNTFTLKNEADTERYEKAAVDVYNPAWSRSLVLAFIKCFVSQEHLL